MQIYPSRYSSVLFYLELDHIHRRVRVQRRSSGASPLESRCGTACYSENYAMLNFPEIPYHMLGVSPHSISKYLSLSACAPVSTAFGAIMLSASISLCLSASVRLSPIQVMLLHAVHATHTCRRCSHGALNSSYMS